MTQNSLGINRDKYIFGRPIETVLGHVRFLTYEEYVTHMNELSLMTMNTLHFYYQYRKQFESAQKLDDPEIIEALADLKSQSLFNIVTSNSGFEDAYRKIFEIVLDGKEHIDSIFSDEEFFLNMRGLVLDMNMLTESEVNENEEIQSYIDADRELKQLDAEKQSYIDFVSSIVIGSNHSFAEVGELTVLQAYAAYYRIGAWKNYDATTLFATVSDKVKIESWNKAIDLFKSEKAGMKMSEFNKKYGSLF